MRRSRRRPGRPADVRRVRRGDGSSRELVRLVRPSARHGRRARARGSREASRDPAQEVGARACSRRAHPPAARQSGRRNEGGLVARRRRFCLRGHDTELTGRSGSGNCQACNAERARSLARRSRERYVDELAAYVDRVELGAKSPAPSVSDLRLVGSRCRAAAGRRRKLAKLARLRIDALRAMGAFELAERELEREVPWI